MIELHGKIRKWGNSYGIVIPKKMLAEKEFEEGEEVRVSIRKKQNVLEETFGTLKFDEPIEKIMREMDEELYPEG